MGGSTIGEEDMALDAVSGQKFRADCASILPIFCLNYAFYLPMIGKKSEDVMLICKNSTRAQDPTEEQQVILTKKQREVYNYIRGFIEDNGYSPSLEEIAAGLGLRSLATVHKHVVNLTDKGVLKRAWNRGRSIEVRPIDDLNVGAAVIPLLGRVAAGQPIEAIETRSTLTVPEDMLGSRETFALQVRGESMIDEQIRNGDFVIIEKRDTAENGETVVALIHDAEATLKKFYREGKMVRLQPANPTLAPLFVPAESVQVQGVVIGVIRKFR